VTVKPRAGVYTGTQLQEQILDLAKVFGWQRAHFRAAMTKYGWRTPVSADGKGFPDLLLLRGRRMLTWECKSLSEKTTPDQDAWLAAFAMIPGCDSRVVRCTDWEYIEEALK
jgi:hypothetical protein